MLENKYKKIIKTMIIIFGLFVCFGNNAMAYSLSGYSLGSSKIVPDFQVFISGKKINDPQKEFILETNKPILFGYAVDNVNIKFTIKSIDHNFLTKFKTISDNKGYWIYYFNEELKHGKYEIFMTMSDTININASSTIVETSPTFQIGTFSIPSVLPKISKSSNDRSLIPVPPLDSLNYFTITLIVAGLVIFKTIFYFIMRIIHSIKE